MKPYEVTIDFQMFIFVIEINDFLMILNNHFFHVLIFLGIHLAPF